MKTGKRVLAFLNARGGEAHVATICDELKISRSVLTSSLQWLVETNQVLRPSRGYYSTTRAKREFTPHQAVSTGSSIPPIPLARLMGQRA